jgi:glycine cleavage system H lipoate-binding protein
MAMTYDLLSVYPAKLLEYGLAMTYLVLFVPFWRYVQGGQRQPAAAPARAGARARARPAAGWFQLPENVHLHPGHTWARLEPDGLVTVGVDDFAHRLVGPAVVALPAVGARVAQGEPAVEIGDRLKMVPLASPVDGTVVAVNQAGLEEPGDPYGAGWLFKVRAPRLAANLRQLLTGGRARGLLEEACDRLSQRMDRELGQVMQDGGVPIHGIARVVAGDEWDSLARGFFLT